LKEPMGYGPFRVFDDKLTAVSHEVTSFLNEFGIVGGCSNKAQHMTVEANTRLTALFKSWYFWAESELEQRFGFKHQLEQAIEVKEVDRRTLMASQQADRPLPSAALRFMRDRLHEARGASWNHRSNTTRFKAISPIRLSWLEVNLKGSHDEVLRAFKKCYRTRLGNKGEAATNEQKVLDDTKVLLEAEVRTEWGLSRADWVEFVENDLRKGGKTIHSITRLAEVPPIGEVVIDGVRRSDDQALLRAEHEKWAAN
jgi:hypothetical protein